jgi:hypothetical protein
MGVDSIILLRLVGIDRESIDRLITATVADKLAVVFMWMYHIICSCVYSFSLTEVQAAFQVLEDETSAMLDTAIVIGDEDARTGVSALIN